MPSPGPRGSGEKHHRVVGTHWSRRLPRAGGEASRGLAGRREQEERGRGVVCGADWSAAHSQGFQGCGPFKTQLAPPTTSPSPETY